MKQDRERLAINSVAIHGGITKERSYTDLVPPISMSNTYEIGPNVSFSADNLDKPTTVYTRWGNPTTRVLERKLAEIEGGEMAAVFSCGMAAVSGLLIGLLKQGDTILVGDVVYPGVREFARDILTDLGVKVLVADTSDLEEVGQLLSENAVKLVFTESPCNPILKITDIEALAQLAHHSGAMLAIDSTFASPVATRPLSLGADFVVHSLTKYISGHGDAMGGAVIGPQQHVSQIKSRMLIHGGGIISPFNAWLINQGIATLPIRMEQHSRSALQVAKFLEAHSNVLKVLYPGLRSHPHHQVAKKQMDLFSGMIAVQVKDPHRTIERIIDKALLFHYAVSLGDLKSKMFFIPTDDMQQTSLRLSKSGLAKYREFAGNGVFRMSVGLEDANDLCNDLAIILD